VVSSFEILQLIICVHLLLPPEMLQMSSLYSGMEVMICLEDGNIWGVDYWFNDKIIGNR